VFRELESVEGMEELLEADVALVFKHSPTCWMSSVAQVAVEEFARLRPDTPIYALDVLAERRLARDLAIELEVPHASPQVIVLRRGKPVWDASHLRITKAAIEEAAA
jgi:bacillithiol system protein YtxJ